LRRDFPHTSRPALGPSQPLVQWVPGLSRGQNGRGVVLTTHPPSNAEIEGRVELYLYSTSGPLWSVLGWNLPLHFTTGNLQIQCCFGYREALARRAPSYCFWPLFITLKC